jgi:leucyl-tRNA synthetase
MSEHYRFDIIEKKWQDKWEQDKIYRTDIDWEKKKHYALTMLPYPSGDLHIGHWYAIVPSDVRARHMKMKGYNVLFPMGFDAFGLPAENAAIHRKVHPFKWTMSNIEKMRAQLMFMGAMFDWQREVITCIPDYYKWTQWFFRRFYDENLIYRKFSPVDFCPKCNTTLAREQVWGEDRHCERCETAVIKKELEQWFFKTTKYAEELLDLSGLDWPERVITMQYNWIGKSTGAEVNFKTLEGEPIRVFTTRPDTLWGATFLVLAPEHPCVDKITTQNKKNDIEKYKLQATRRTEVERLGMGREKTGVFTGGYVMNPVTDEKIPVWIADYVVMTYGTGAIMAVPAHDERDFDFAKKYNLPIRVVIAPQEWDGEELGSAYTDVNAGKIVNSGQFNGVDVSKAGDVIIKFLEEKSIGRHSVSYRLRDWLLSRQRYWGAPIPIIYCKQCGTVPVCYENLPVLLPEDAEIPASGENALKYHKGFFNTTCPKCKSPATRETDTMDTFVCSSWYQYAYLSPYWKKGEKLSKDSLPFDPKQAAYWLPVDVYTGGIEHATMHLIYTRVWTKAMRDCGVINFSEPMIMLRNQGIILGEDSEKMSKSRGNVVSPDDLVQRYGADAVRAYLMFGWKWEQGGPWDSKGIEGVSRFLSRVWTLFTKDKPKPQSIPTEDKIKEFKRMLHRTIKSITEDIERFNFNTIIASLMEFLNYLYKEKETAVYGTKSWEEALDVYLLLLAPCCPFIAEELWEKRGKKYSIHQQNWPVYDVSALELGQIQLPIQINGKVRSHILVLPEASDEAIKEEVLSDERIRQWIGASEIKKFIIIKGKIVNIVV